MTLRALPEPELTLHEIWALPLEEQHRRRKYEPWAYGREIQLTRENAAPDFPRIGPFYLLKEQRTGITLVIDGRRPWNKARVFEHVDERVARQWAEDRTRKETQERKSA